MAEGREKAGWGIRLAAVAATLLVVVVVFAVKFSAHGNEMSAMFAAAIPLIGGVVAAYILGFIKRFANGGTRWRVYLYALLALTAYLIIVEFI